MIIYTYIYVYIYIYIYIYIDRERERDIMVICGRGETARTRAYEGRPAYHMAVSTLFDHGRHRNAKRYNLWCNCLSGGRQPYRTTVTHKTKKRKLENNTVNCHYTNKVETPIWFVWDRRAGSASLGTPGPGSRFLS